MRNIAANADHDHDAEALPCPSTMARALTAHGPRPRPGQLRLLGQLRDDIALADSQWAQGRPCLSAREAQEEQHAGHSSHPSAGLVEVIRHRSDRSSDARCLDAQALGGPRFGHSRRRLARYQPRVCRPSDERLPGIGSQGHCGRRRDGCTPERGQGGAAPDGEGAYHAPSGQGQPQPS